MKELYRDKYWVQLDRQCLKKEYKFIASAQKYKVSQKVVVKNALKMRHDIHLQSRMPQTTFYRATIRGSVVSFVFLSILL